MSKFTRPDNWDNIEAAKPGVFEKLPAGAYICQIVKAHAQPSKKGDEMLVLTLDIYNGDYAGFFASAEYPPMYYQLIKSERFLKHLIESIEYSNDSFKWDWDANSLIGKLCCGVFGEEEYINKNGEIRSNMRIKYITTIAEYNLGTITPPEPVKVKSNNIATSGNMSSAPNDYYDNMASDYAADADKKEKEMEDSDLPF